MKNILFVTISLLIVSFVNQANAESYYKQGRKNDLRRGVKAFGKKEFKKSERIWRKLLRVDPYNQIYMFNMGNTKFALGELDDAEEYYTKVIKFGKSLKQVGRLFLAKVMRVKGKNKRAILLLKELLEHKLTDNIYRMALDEIDKHAHREEKYYNKGIEQFEKNNIHKAFFYFSLAWTLSPNDSNNFMLGYCMLKRGEIEKGKEYFKSIEDIDTYEESQELLEEYEYVVVLEDADDPWSGYVDYSRGSNSNPSTAAPDSGSSIYYDDEINASFGLTYTYASFLSWAFNVGIDGYLYDLVATDNSKSTGNGYSMGFIFAKGSQYLSLQPKFEKTYYDEEAYVNNKTGTLNYALTFDWGKISIYGSQTIYVSQEDDYDYLNGTGGVLYFTLSKYIDDHEISLTVQATDDDLEDSDYTVASKQGNGVELGTYLTLSKSWVSEFSFNYFYTIYDEDADDFVQIDNTLTTSITFTWTGTEWLSVYMKEKYVNNVSTLDDDTDSNNYYQNVISFGTTVSF